VPSFPHSLRRRLPERGPPRIYTRFGGRSSRGSSPESCAICGFRQRKQSRNISENKGVNNAIIVPSMNSDGVRSVRPASANLEITPIHSIGARRRGFSMANRRSDEISAAVESRTGLREPTKGEPRARRSRNVIENKVSCKNVMRIPTMNRQPGRLRFGAPHRGWRQYVCAKLESNLESSVDELGLHPSSANNELEPPADSDHRGGGRSRRLVQCWKLAHELKSGL
jgi:hypothetical protein